MLSRWLPWLRTPKAEARPHSPEPFGPWLELDRVRTVLSCVLLIGLLALIIIGGQRATGTLPNDMRSSRLSPYADILLAAPPQEKPAQSGTGTWPKSEP